MPGRRTLIIGLRKIAGSLGYHASDHPVSRRPEPFDLWLRRALGPTGPRRGQR